MIFIKLDIRQVFYYIRIDPDLEELIIFRIYYNTYKYKVFYLA
jgi:hypothetical protein